MTIESDFLKTLCFIERNLAEPERNRSEFRGFLRENELCLLRNRAEPEQEPDVFWTRSTPNGHFQLPGDLFFKIKNKRSPGPAQP